jgi:hypothetical protein
VAIAVAVANPVDGFVRCPGCDRPFLGCLALDVHRRHPRAPAACRYTAGEPRAGFRLGLAHSGG